MGNSPWSLRLVNGKRQKANGKWQMANVGLKGIHPARTRTTPPFPIGLPAFLFPVSQSPDAVANWPLELATGNWQEARSKKQEIKPVHPNHPRLQPKAQACSTHEVPRPRRCSLPWPMIHIQSSFINNDKANDNG